MYPIPNNDNFQQQLNDLQRSYSQLGKAAGPQFTGVKHEFTRTDGIDGARAWAKENLAPGESYPLFDENKDEFYAVSKSPDGVLQPLYICPYTMEPEPPKPEYATKQDLAKLESMLQQLLEKENKA